MHLVQILLPVRDNEGRAFGRDAFARVRGELTDRFGGVTAHLRSPAEGAWRDPGGEVDRDDVVILEVMVPRRPGGALPAGRGGGTGDGDGAAVGDRGQPATTTAALAQPA
ncbi:MAG: hypothetical protein ABW277_14460 [Longimicrobiaceae bacterium]